MNIRVTSFNLKLSILAILIFIILKLYFLYASVNIFSMSFHAQISSKKNISFNKKSYIVDLLGRSNFRLLFFVIICSRNPKTFKK